MLMTEYINNLLEGKNVDVGTETIVIHDGFDGGNNNVTYIEYDRMDGILYINVDLMTNFMTWFSRNVGETKDFFQNWFENKFNVKVNDTLTSFF